MNRGKQQRGPQTSQSPGTRKLPATQYVLHAGLDNTLKRSRLDRRDRGRNCDLTESMALRKCTISYFGKAVVQADMLQLGTPGTRHSHGTVGRR